MTVLYGCMGLGGPWDAPTYAAAEIDQAAAVIEAAIAAGMTTFDHADIYTRGKAESVFGEVLARSAGLRERITLQTKCGIRLAEGERPGLYDLRRDTILARVRESLTRLQVDSVDVLLLHRPDPLADVREIAAAVGELRGAGLIGAVGVSNMNVAQVRALQNHLDEPLVSNQLEMSLARRAWVEDGVQVNTVEGAEVEFPTGMVEYADERSLQLQAWGSLAQGRYTGRAGTPAELATTQLVSEVAERHTTTPETVLLWWLQKHPVGIAPVVGSTNPARIAACADAATRAPELTHEEWYELWVTARGGPLP